MSPLEETHNMPIYQKAEQIFQLTQGLIQIVPLEDEFLQETVVKFMAENAMLIPVKIAGAEGGDLYDLRMENAAIIRKAARELYVQAGSLRAVRDNARNAARGGDQDPVPLRTQDGTAADAGAARTARFPHRPHRSADGPRQFG